MTGTMVKPHLLLVRSWCGFCSLQVLQRFNHCFLFLNRWVKVRWALLILFWLGWLGMLAGAIAIIIQAPRCKPLPEMNWWNYGPLYQIGDVKSFASNLEGKDRQLHGPTPIPLKWILWEGGSVNGLQGWVILGINDRFQALNMFKCIITLSLCCWVDKWFSGFLPHSLACHPVCSAHISVCELY